jgi:lambda family phage portal protein
VNGKAYEVIPAHKVLHLFITEAIGQKRGLPMMAGALFRMNMLAGYEDAAITAARVGASKMGFFTSPDGDGYTGSGEDSDGAIITDSNPGTFEQLPTGVTFQSYDPDYPHQQFGEFVKTCLRGISSGLNVSYHALSNDLEGVNYSSIRAGVLEDRETWKSLQSWFIEGLVRPVYEQWIKSSVLRGAIALPGGNTLRVSDTDRYMAASYQPRRWAWVDPQKDTTANILAVQNALKSRGEIIREQGRDPDDVWRELAEEQERLKQLGITSAEMTVNDAAALNSGAADENN